MFDLDYFVTIQEMSFSIFNSKDMKVVQEIRELEEPLVNIYFLQNKNFLMALCKRRMYFFKCVYSLMGTIK